MSHEDELRVEREDIEMLLPWYATGTLEPEEKARVDAYLADHPEVARQLDLVAEEMDQTIRVNEALGAPAPGALDRLMADVRAESPQAFRASGGGLIESVLSWFGDLSPRAAAMGAALAIAVICAQAVTIGVVTSGKKYDTASGETTGRIAGTTALVGFVDSASVADVTGLLTSYGAAIVDGPKPGGIYRVRLSEKELAKADLDALLEKLLADPRVRLALAEGGQ